MLDYIYIVELDFGDGDDAIFMYAINRNDYDAADRIARRVHKEWYEPHDEVWDTFDKEFEACLKANNIEFRIVEFGVTTVNWYE